MGAAGGGCWINRKVSSKSTQSCGPWPGSQTTVPAGSDRRVVENHFLPTSVSWSRQMNPTGPHPAFLAAHPSTTDLFLKDPESLHSGCRLGAQTGARGGRGAAAGLGRAGRPGAGGASGSRVHARDCSPGSGGRGGPRRRRTPGSSGPFDPEVERPRRRPGIGHRPAGTKATSALGGDA